MNCLEQYTRITLIECDACQCFGSVEQLISKEERTLVIEDSSHTYDNTLNVLRLYSRLIKPGDYFIVEDSICHHGLTVGPRPGPYEAIEAFLNENSDFEIDRSREHFFITWNPKGYLKRTKLEHNDSPVKKLGLCLDKLVKQSSVRETLRLFIPPILILMLRKLTNLRSRVSQRLNKIFT